MLLPVAVLLLGMGSIGFVFARKALLEQWGEAALLKLERSAHNIDMRLSRPKVWVAILQKTSGTLPGGPAKQFILQQLRETPGVVRVDLKTQGTAAFTGSGKKTHRSGRHMHLRHDDMHPMSDRPFHRMEGLEITPPRFDPEIGSQTVSMISELKEENGTTAGTLEVVLNFSYLMDAITPSGWWQSNKAFLVDDHGFILTGASQTARKQLGDTGSELEHRTLAALMQKTSGTIIGEGHPPKEVSGFYRLKEAPWDLVLFAPGKKVLSPIIQFRLYYFIVAGIFILFILLLIRWVTGRTAKTIKAVTLATRNVARGSYDNPLTASTSDEVGELIRNFNSMTLQLEERMRLKHSLRLAEGVQQSLLPRTSPVIPGFDIAGICEFCEEIGGDYYDFLESGKTPVNTFGIVVGDVSDHGIPSALLMATVRAMLRQRMTQPGNLSEAIADVNRQLCADVENSGRFVTLFCLDIDMLQKEFRWVRAGHDAAFLYEEKSGRFQELSGRGLPLGVLETADYEDVHHPIATGQILAIGTDGIWETRNQEGRLFGKNRFLAVIRENRHRSATEITKAVLDALRDYRCPFEQEDDITLVVVKIGHI